MICEGFDAFSHSDVPHFYEGVVASCDNIRLKLLSKYWTYSVSMSHKRMYLPSYPDIPNSGGTIPTSSHQDTQTLMDLQTVHTTQMSMVAPDHLVHL